MHSESRGSWGYCFFFSWTGGRAEDNPSYLGLITGGANTTAYRIGKDIQALARFYDIELTIHHSRGDIENVVAVYQRPGNHLGLVGSDVLALVNKVEDEPRLKLIANKVKWLLPLYDRDVHLLANANVKTFSDLNGYRVAVGNRQSGSFLTSQLLFEISGIKPLELIAMEKGTALAAMRDGRIDAMLIVEGAPSAWLGEWISPADGLHLIPVTGERIRAFYPVSRIPDKTYPWQVGAVDTVSVKTILVAYDFRNEYCHFIGKLAWLIRENLPWLRKYGHPKWNTVDVSKAVKGGAPYACALDYMPASHGEPDLRLPETESNPVVDAIQALFSP